MSYTPLNDICYSSSRHAYCSSVMTIIRFSSYICVSCLLTWLLLLVHCEIRTWERELERLEEDCERERALESKSRIWWANFDSMLKCFNVDLVEGRVDSMFASAATSDLHAATCSNLGELIHSFNLSLYLASLLNNWYLIEEEFGWVFPLVGFALVLGPKFSVSHFVLGGHRLCNWFMLSTIA